MIDHITPPFNQDRCDELDSANLPNYKARSDLELKDAMRSRGIELLGRRKKAHYVRALEASDNEDLQRYQVWKDCGDFVKTLNSTWELPIAQDYDVVQDWDIPALRALLNTRPDRMFASSYQEDPTRKTFLDLPGEIRNTIYNFTLSAHRGTFGKIHLLVAKRQFLMWHRE
jgi:hypothetical protein